MEQGAPVILAKRHALDRAGRSAALLIGWLAALHTDPSIARRAELLARHERVAEDLGGDRCGSRRSWPHRSSGRRRAAGGRKGRGTLSMQTKKIGFVGAGNMAGALVKGLLLSGTVTAGQIRVQ